MMSLSDETTKDILAELDKRCGLKIYFFLERNGCERPILHSECTPGAAASISRHPIWLIDCHGEMERCITSMLKIHNVGAIRPNGEEI